MKKDLNKLIAVVGPTAAGKTKLGVMLADQFNGEIISADSRQVYRGMDIGTGKDLAEYDLKKGKAIKKIKYHLIDVADPKEGFDLAKFVKMGREAIGDILSRGCLPIVVGGSGLYIQALLEGFDLPSAKPDNNLREELETKTIDELFDLINKKNPHFAEKINESDRKNKRRLIRYVEVISSPEKVAPKKFGVESVKYDVLVLGVDLEKEKLHENIEKRLYNRLDNEGMVEEVATLQREGLSWEKLNDFGLEYRWLSRYLKDEVDYDEMKEKIISDSKKFAKRQLTWLRRWEKQGRKIFWVKDYSEAEREVEKFIK